MVSALKFKFERRLNCFSFKKPASELPMLAKSEGASFVIVNLQETPLDAETDLRIFGKCDQVFQLVFSELEMRISEFHRTSTLKISGEVLCVDEKKEVKYIEFKVTGKEGHRSPFIEEVELGLCCSPDKHLLTSPFTKTVRVPKNTNSIDVNASVRLKVGSPEILLSYKVEGLETGKVFEFMREFTVNKTDYNSRIPPKSKKRKADSKEEKNKKSK